MNDGSKLLTASALVGLLALIGIVCFSGTNRLPLFDWDELNFAEVSREMLVTGQSLRPTINYIPFNEKPPLFFWLQRWGFEWFGVTPRGARWPNLVCGIVTFLALYRLGRSSFPSPRRFLVPLFFSLSLLPLLYVQSGIIDPWFNLFILLGLWASFTRRVLDLRSIVLSGGLLGLAVLTKGPAAGLIAGLCWLVLLVRHKDARWRRAAQFGAIGLVALTPSAIWLTAVWRVDGGTFVVEFLSYQWRLFFQEDAGHGGFPGYHVIVLLLGCFPAGWFALPSLFGRPAWLTDTDRGMRILFWVVLVLFSVVNTKIIHYSSLCYFPLAWMAARSVQRVTRPESWKWVNWGVLTTWALYCLAAVALPTAAATLPMWLPGITDPELQSRLQLPVQWPWYTFLPAAVALLGLSWQLFHRHAHKVKRLTTTIDRQTWAYGHLAITGLFVLAGLFTLAPRIQQYTQGSPVAFFQTLAGEDVYVGTAYYKSYAHWYYAAPPPGRYDKGCRDRQCRFHGPTTKALYFASPLRKTDQVLREVPDARLLNQSGGFSFYLRPAAIK